MVPQPMVRNTSVQGSYYNRLGFAPQPSALGEIGNSSQTKETNLSNAKMRHIEHMFSYLNTK